MPILQPICPTHPWKKLGIDKKCLSLNDIITLLLLTITQDFQLSGYYMILQLKQYALISRVF